MSNNKFIGRKRSQFRPLLLELTDIQKQSMAASIAIHPPILNVRHGRRCLAEHAPTIFHHESD